MWFLPPQPPDDPPITLRRCVCCHSLTQRTNPWCACAVCPRRECIDDHRKEHVP